MLNMLDTQDKLKNFSEEQLIREMQMPSGSAPQFMVLSEIERRKRMRSDAQRQEGLMQPTVAQEAVSAAGVPQQGIAQVAQSMAPKTDMTQNTGVPNVQAAGLPAQPNQPQRMADGGVMRLAPGGQMSGETLSAIASLKVTNPDIYEKYKDDPRVLEQMAKAFAKPYALLEVAEDPEMTTLESLEAPSTSFKTSNFRDNVAGGLKTFMQRRRDDKEFGEDYALDQRAKSLAAVYRAERDPNSMLFDTSLQDLVKGESSLQGSKFAVEEALPFNRMADPSSRYQSRLPSAGFQRERTDINASGDPSETGSTAPLAYEAEKARQAYLAGGDYSESGVPAIVDMLNRGREFQQSDTYTPPEMIYDLDPRSRLKYEMNDATPLEKDRAFAAESDRLGIENAIDQDRKEKEANARALAARNKELRESREYLDGLRMQRNQLSGVERDKDPLGISKFFNDNREAKSGKLREDSFSIEQPESYLDKLKGFNWTANVPTRDKEAESAKLREDSLINNSGLAAIKKPVKKTPPSTDDDKQTFKSTAQNMNQDKWLALAQAGLTLMSTGDFGKAGSAGLAALRESKKTDLAERKIRSDEAFNEARIEAAKKGKSIPGALITSLSKELMQLQDAYSLIADTAYDSYFGLGDRVDPDRVERTILENKINEIRRRLEFAYRSYGMGSYADASPKNEQYNVASKAE